MPRYAITEKAGRFVAGTNNTGVGTVLTLTEKQAEHELRLGTLVPVDMPVATPAAQEPAQEGKDAPKAPTQPKAKKGAAAPADGANEGTGGDA
jgi:hypothetical protein